MECWTLLHGGYNYSPPYADDAEHHDTIEQAETYFWHWTEEPINLVDDSTEMYVYLYDPNTVDDYYPDFRVYLGPRGGVRRERA